MSQGPPLELAGADSCALLSWVAVTHYYLF